jgi:hypothetical protein
MLPCIKERPDRDLEEMHQDRPGRDANEHPRRRPEAPLNRADRRTILRLRHSSSGVIYPLERVPDPVFSQKLAGDGISISRRQPPAGTLRPARSCNSTLPVTR